MVDSAGKMTWVAQQMNGVGRRKEDRFNTGGGNQLSVEGGKFYKLDDPISSERKFRDISTRGNV